MSPECRLSIKSQTRIVLVQLTYPSSPFPGPNLPVGLGYIAEQLELSNILYDVIDLSIDSKEDFFKHIVRTCPEYIALSMMSLDAERHYELAFEIKKYFPMIKIIAGGAHISFVKEKALKDCTAIDFGIVHEGEETLIELLNDHNLPNIKGLLYHDKDGGIAYTGPRTFINNLDQLAFPRYRRFKLERYGVTIPVASSRGCPFSCTFCGAFLSMGKNWRARSVQSIVEELEFWQQKGYSSFNFIDSNFFMSKERVIDLCDALSDRNLNISLSSDGMRAKDADPVMLKKLKQFGLQSVAIGIESANDDILDFIKKGETLADLTRCMETLIDLDINVIAFFIIGLPGETIKHVLNSFKFALQYPNISAAYFFNPNPLPGTELFIYAAQHNMLRGSEAQILDNIGGMGNQILLETEELPISRRKKLLELSQQVSHLVNIRHKAYSERQRLSSRQGINSCAEIENIDNHTAKIMSLFDGIACDNKYDDVDENDIFTHLTHEEKCKLTELAMACTGSTFVEIGSYLGASSCFISSGIKNSCKPAKLYCVDTWINNGMSEGFRDTYDTFLANTKSYKNIIVPLRGTSEAIAKSFDKEIDFLFIDAGHDYENVKADVSAWFPKLRAGAQVVFHDIGWAEGVQQVVKEHVREIAYNEGTLPNMYWASVSQPLKPLPEETLSSLNRQRDPSDLIQRLIAAGISVTHINLDINEFISWLADFREVLNRYANSNDVLIEKCLEHYIAYKFSTPERGQVYIDIAAAGSNWTDCLINRGVTAYSLDLAYPEGIHGNKIGANAAATGLPDNSVDAMSLQCAFETFQGDYDTLFISESKRILKEGGKLVISPLYLDTRHFILSSKNTDFSKTPLDDGAIRVWREDEYDEAFSRHYSPEALAKRIFSKLDGLSAKVLYIDNLDQLRSRFPGQRIYCDFNLYLKKTASPKENQISLSVIVPTRNRAALLRNTLESFTRQTYPTANFEVIVVDNGSTDNTAEVCQHFKQIIPHLKRISVADPGLHNGRHAGLKEASGEILVYADDDIEAMPTWLEAIASSFRDPKVALVGGKILPKFESQPPEWVAALGKKTDSGWSLGWYSILDFGDTEHEIPHEYVWGCNFSVRKSVLQQVGGFHPDSFPQEMIKYRGDGETAVSKAIQELGYKAYYHPKASVYHVVSQTRLTREYIYERARNQGISDSYTSIRTNRVFSCLKTYNAPTSSIHDVVNHGYVDGFNYHQQMVTNDASLLDWVLRDNYIDSNDKTNIHFRISGSDANTTLSSKNNFPEFQYKKVVNDAVAEFTSSRMPNVASFICLKPFTTIEVHTDGSCKFCCYTNKSIGNIKLSDVNDIFNSNVAQDIRRRFYLGNYSDCDTTRCPLFSSDNNVRYDNIPSDDLLYRHDIYNCITNKSTIIDCGPSRIIESAHGLCNVKCEFCWPFERFSLTNYSNEVYKWLLNCKSTTREVHLAGGEPFFNPMIDTLITNLLNKGISFSATTNMSCITDSTKLLLEKVNIGCLHGSINAASKTTYNKLVQGGRWESVCENLRFVSALKSARPDLTFGISMVVNSINYHEILDFIKVGIEMYDVDYIALYAPDERHMPVTLKLTRSDADNILAMLEIPAITQLANKLNTLGLKNHLMNIKSIAQILE